MAGRAQTKQTRQRAREAFLTELARRGIVQDAAEFAAVGRATMYEWRAADPDFAKEWDEALEVAADRLEAEAWRRGVEGVEEPVFGRIAKDLDGEIGTIRKYSDTMLDRLLKARRPDKFRERHDLDVTHSGALQIEYINDWRKAD